MKHLLAKGLTTYAISWAFLIWSVLCLSAGATWMHLADTAQTRQAIHDWVQAQRSAQ